MAAEKGMKWTGSRLSEWVQKLQGAGCDIGLDSAYNQYMITNRRGDINLSTRMRPGELANWLDGYEHGKQEGQDAAQSRWLAKLSEVANRTQTQEDHKAASDAYAVAYREADRCGDEAIALTHFMKSTEHYNAWMTAAARKDKK